MFLREVRMLARAFGAVLHGVDATLVTVEVDLSSGLPAFTVVGLPDATVQEARDRVRGAIIHSGRDYPMCRITANLAPSDVRKQGSGLDLVLAIGILVADGKAPAQGLDGRLFCGELGLSGDVRPIRGALQVAETAAAGGVREVVCPAANAEEAALAGLPAVGVRTLREALDVLRGQGPTPTIADPSAFLTAQPPASFDIAQIRDQDRAKRVLEIAAAGGHNVLFSGPPGSGKTLLARALPGILPPLTLAEALQVTRIHSAVGLLPAGEPLVRTRPFRAPHHGVSAAGMVGGGSSWTRPGEVTLAHRGVLMMDEFPEFPRSVLEALRQPLEDGVVTITRARQTSTYPARFILVAAMNPCPCGHLGTERPCRCPPRTLQIYRQRVSGPLLDRIDLHVSVGRVDAAELLCREDVSRSAEVRERVTAARAAGASRHTRWNATCNAEIPHRALLRTCGLDEGSGAVLTRAANRYRLSARSVHRVLRVARTIADLDSREPVGRDDVLEALTYRLAEREEHP
ncbi:MAG: YifB family Mg chelatase-like AAA ATPase [Actinomycetota bacterium]